MKRSALLSPNMLWTVAFPEFACESDTDAAVWILHCDADPLSLRNNLVSFGAHLSSGCGRRAFSTVNGFAMCM